MANTKIRLATASPGTRATTQETLAEVRQIAERAAAQHADLLLLPEAYIGGYPRGADFGCQVGARSAAGREAFRRYFRAAVDLGDTVGEGGAGAGDAWVKRQLPANAQPASSATATATNGDGDGNDGGNGVGVGDGHRGGSGSGSYRGDGTREELERIARDTGVFVVVGLIERAGGSLYCAVGYVCPKLGFVGKRRKVLPTGSERLIWAQGSPATLKAVSTTIRGVRINLAAAICWENYMPLLRQALYAQNVNLWLAPTADNRDAWLALMRTVALEGRCFVVSSNMCVRNGSGSDAERGVKEEKQTAAAAVVSEDEDEDGGGHVTATKIGSGGRRNSCLTEEGFEIALPSADADAAAAAAAAVADTDNDDITAPATTTQAPPPTAAAVARARKQPKAETFLSRGGSAIVAPDGAVIAGPQWEDDRGLVYADVDFDDCVRGRLDLDAAGSYSRNDSFKFSVEGLDLDPLPYY